MTETKTSETKPLTTGESFYVSLGGAAAGTCVCVSGLHLRVVGETEKAVRVEAYREDGRASGASCWLPRKALQPRREDPVMRSFSLARWFRPDGYASRFLERHQIIGGVSL